MNITIFSTQTNSMTTISSSATTWGELKTELTANNISYANMKALVRETKVTLESPEAMLPTTDFTLFLTPDKVKSGLVCA